MLILFDGTRIRRISQMFTDFFYKKRDIHSFKSVIICQIRSICVPPNNIDIHSFRAYDKISCLNYLMTRLLDYPIDK